MAQTYKSVNLDAPSGGGSPIFESTFSGASWVLNVDQYEIEILETVHGLGTSVVVQVEELVGSFYQEVDVVIQNENGNIRIIVGDDSRFTGRILIKG